MRPITAILVEFPRPVHGAPVADAAAAPDAGDEPAAPATLEQALDDARRIGHDEGRSLAEAAWPARLADLDEAHARALDAARARWAAEEGAVLAEALGQSFRALEESLARGLAAALPGFIASAVRRRAGEEMQGAITRLLAGGVGTLIAVRGPADLVAPLRRAFDGHAAVSFEEVDVPDVSLRAGDALVATQVAAWQARLQLALEEPA